jgi:non-specific serine/threonine protein kinase/serine/threonine-protein kinase
VVHNLALVLKDLGKFAEAEPYFREVLEAGRRNQGDDHPDLLPSIHAMGSVLEAQGKLAEAEPYYHEVLEKCRRLLGPDHLGTLASIHSMGSLLEAQGKLAEAEPYYREALEGRRRVFGAEHRSTLKSFRNTSQCLAAQGKLEDALTLCRDFIEHLRSQVPDGDVALGAATGSFGQLLVEQQEYEEAEPLLRECLPIRESTLHPKSADYWLIAQTRSLLGCALVGRGAAVASSNPWQAIELFTEAEPLVLDGYEWLSQNFEQINPALRRELRIKRVSEAGERIVWLYETWHAAEPDAGHDVRAAEWRAELDNLPGP